VKGSEEGREEVGERSEWRRRRGRWKGEGGHEMRREGGGGREEEGGSRREEKGRTVKFSETSQHI